MALSALHCGTAVHAVSRTAVVWPTIKDSRPPNTRNSANISSTLRCVHHRPFSCACGWAAFSTRRSRPTFLQSVGSSACRLQEFTLAVASALPYDGTGGPIDLSLSHCCVPHAGSLSVGKIDGSGSQAKNSRSQDRSLAKNVPPKAVSIRSAGTDDRCRCGRICLADRERRAAGTNCNSAHSTGSGNSNSATRCIELSDSSQRKRRAPARSDFVGGGGGHRDSQRRID